MCPNMVNTSLDTQEVFRRKWKLIDQMNSKEKWRDYNNSSKRVFFLYFSRNPPWPVFTSLWEYKKSCRKPLLHSLADSDKPKERRTFTAVEDSYLRRENHCKKNDFASFWDSKYIAKTRMNAAIQCIILLACLGICTSACKYNLWKASVFLLLLHEMS